MSILAAESKLQTPVYIIVPPSPLFAAHWSFFIPEISKPTVPGRRDEVVRTGRRIHVSGDRLNGFCLEIVRGYNVGRHRSVGADRQYLVGMLTQTQYEGGEQERPAPADCESPRAVQKDDDEGGGYVDNTPRDEFERLCIEIEAPGPSLNKISAMSAAGVVGNGKRTKMEVRDCQWIRQVVEAMVDRGILIKATSEELDPLDRVKKLPVH